MNDILKRVQSIAKSLLSTDIRVVAATLVSIGILHICATLAAPHLVESSAFHRLEPALPLHKMKILREIDAETQPIPFLSPDVRYAMCRFDSTQGTITIEATLPNKGWTLSIHTPQGDNIYTATGQDARETQVALKVVASVNSFSGLTPQSLGRSLSAEPQETIEARTGLAILRAPDRGKSYERNTILTMRHAKCYSSKK